MFDPSALRSIVLKEQGTYDQIPWLIEYVSMCMPASFPRSDHLIAFGVAVEVRACFWARVSWVSSVGSRYAMPPALKGALDAVTHGGHDAAYVRK